MKKKKSVTKKGLKGTKSLSENSLHAAVIEKFPSAEIIDNSVTRVEFLLPSANEELCQTINKIFNDCGAKFYLIERLEDFKIRAVISSL